MPDWMKHNHVKRMAAERRPVRACADCARWRCWARGDERCGVCVRVAGELVTCDGWAEACPLFAARAGEARLVGERVAAPRGVGREGRGVGRGGAGGGGVRLFDL